MNIIWVATNGNDTTGTGTETNPYLTIERARAAFTDGDQIRIKDGTYTPVDALVFTGFTSGAMVADNPGEVTIQPTSVTASIAVIDISSCTRFELRGITVSQATDPTRNYVGIIANNIDNFICENCRVANFDFETTSAGIYAPDCYGIIKGCTVTDCTASGTEFYGIHALKMDITDCVISNITGESCTHTIGVQAIDPLPWPTVVSAVAIDYQTVDVTFDMDMYNDAQLRAADNYTVTGDSTATVTGVSVTGLRTVRLTCSNLYSLSDYTVEVSVNITEATNRKPVDPGNNSAEFVSVFRPSLELAVKVTPIIISVIYDAAMANDGELDRIANYGITGPTTVTISGASIINSYQVDLTVSGLTHSSTYTVTVQNVSDTLGSLINPPGRTTTFVTENAPIVDSALAIDNKRVYVWFSNTMLDNAEYTKVANYSVDLGCTVQVVTKISNSVVRLTVSGPHSILYTLTVNTAIEDINGNHLSAGTNTATFTLLEVPEPDLYVFGTEFDTNYMLHVQKYSPSTATLLSHYTEPDRYPDNAPPINNARNTFNMIGITGRSATLDLPSPAVAFIDNTFAVYNSLGPNFDGYFNSDRTLLTTLWFNIAAKQGGDTSHTSSKGWPPLNHRYDNWATRTFANTLPKAYTDNYSLVVGASYDGTIWQEAVFNASDFSTRFVSVYGTPARGYAFLCADKSYSTTWIGGAHGHYIRTDLGYVVQQFPPVSNYLTGIGGISNFLFIRETHGTYAENTDVVTVEFDPATFNIRLKINAAAYGPAVTIIGSGEYTVYAADPTKYFVIDVRYANAPGVLRTWTATVCSIPWIGAIQCLADDDVLFVVAGETFPANTASTICDVHVFRYMTATGFRDVTPYAFHTRWGTRGALDTLRYYYDPIWCQINAYNVNYISVGWHKTWPGAATPDTFNGFFDADDLGSGQAIPNPNTYGVVGDVMLSCFDVTVTPPTVAPAVDIAEIAADQIRNVQVNFTQTMMYEAAVRNPANYNIPGLVVSAVLVNIGMSGTFTSVTLLTNDFTSGVTYTVTVTNVQSAAGIGIDTSNNTATFTAPTFLSVLSASCTDAAHLLVIFDGDPNYDPTRNPEDLVYQVTGPTVVNILEKSQPALMTLGVDYLQPGGAYTVTVTNLAANGAHVVIGSNTANFVAPTWYTANLLVYYKFNGDLLDSSGNGRTASAGKTPVYAAGKLGQALSFDGDVVTNHPAGVYQGVTMPWFVTSATYGVTFVAWVKPVFTPLFGRSLTIFHFYNSDNDYIWFGIEPVTFSTPYIGRFKLIVKFSTIYEESTSVGTVTVNQWYHVAVTDKAGALTSYVNGQLAMTNSIPAYENIGVKYIGHSFIGNLHGTGLTYGKFFSGLMDHVRIYGYGLSEDELVADYNGGAGFAF